MLGMPFAVPIRFVNACLLLSCVVAGGQICTPGVFDMMLFPWNSWQVWELDYVPWLHGIAAFLIAGSVNMSSVSFHELVPGWFRSKLTSTFVFGSPELCLF